MECSIYPNNPKIRSISSLINFFLFFPFAELLEPITPEEQATHLRAHEYYIRQICKKPELRLPPKILATALVFFKRFYLFHSIIDYNVKYIAPTCVYISCKIEENYIDVEEFCKVINYKADQILKLEVKVMETLKFQFVVYHPYRPLDGFVMDIKTRSRYQNMDKIHATAITFLDLAMITDLVLFYPPSQIALAALKLAFASVSQSSDFDNYLRGRFSDAEFFSTIEESITRISETINSSPSQAQVIMIGDASKLVDAKLKKKKVDPNKKRELVNAKEKEEVTKKKKLDEKDQKAKEQMELLTGIKQDGSI
eukprot:TRINITY_DN2807_c0_g1_i1.p1 TRINITY_DN2807_c0_g1~~TRINITY_DN2807_c0_g1_i1.p1  ORF type:complete len:311 (+),score=29.35 TRINITY_DN2807_c0_g1_i1:292-1224(+)